MSPAQTSLCCKREPQEAVAEDLVWLCFLIHAKPACKKIFPRSLAGTTGELDYSETMG